MAGSHFSLSLAAASSFQWKCGNKRQKLGTFCFSDSFWPTVHHKAPDLAADVWWMYFWLIESSYYFFTPTFNFQFHPRRNRYLDFRQSWCWMVADIHICDFMGNSITRVFPEVEEEAEGVKDGLEIDKEQDLLKSGSVRATWLQGRERQCAGRQCVCVWGHTVSH